MTVRVMVVEDERIIALNLQQRLVKLGYEVPMIATTGDQALKHVDSDHPDIVLMDIHIQGDIDGIETAERISKRSPTPIIYLTAYSEEATLNRARATRPYGYLMKPCSERELHATIQMALERAQVEAELRQARSEIGLINSQLEERIRERTEQLVVAKREAEDANLAKSYFLANMSHEIRTPLNAILGLCYLLQTTTLTSQQRDYVEKADAAAQFLFGMLNDILDFSKIEARKLELEQIDFQLGDLLKNVAKILSVRAHEKGLELNIDLQAAVALRGDPLRLQQILVNLGSNAVKFTDRGKVSISAEVISENKNPVAVRFSVLDTGLGLSTDQTEQLFRAFHQVDTSMTRRYHGSGLGLAICKRLVELMGGEIGVESKPGRGSLFYFTVQLPPASAKMIPMRNSVASMASQTLAGARILVVEDNVLNQEVAKGILMHHGAQVDVAADGEQAIEIFRTDAAPAYDIVLMDLQMPGLDGFQTTQAIRSMTTASLPILAMTADTLLEHRQQCLAAGMNDFIAKPINVEQMLATLLVWLNK